MAESGIPRDVQQFVAETIDQAEQLDILLLLYRNPDRAYTAEEVSQAVFTVPTSATMRLEGLVVRGLLASTGGSNPAYRYQPASGQTASRVDQLAAAYAADRVGVIKLIFSAPPDPLATFANAFKLKGK